MNHHENLKILAFVGLSGSGKSTAVEYFTEKGFPRVYFGGIIYQAMKEAGIEQGEKNEQVFRVEIRKKEGVDFAAKRIVQQIHDLADAGQHRVIADGLYTWDEYKLLKHEFPAEMNVVAIITPKADRYKRLETRDERPQTHEITMERDKHEIEDIQKGGPIAAADYYVMNDGSKDELHAKLAALQEEISF